MARNLVHQAVFVALIRESGDVLLHRRANTGYMDGRYDFPSGHVERHETLLSAAAREVFEEVGVQVAEADLELFHIGQFDNGTQYVNYFYRTKSWTGEPRICEPEKCDDLQFFDIGTLPACAPATALSLEHVHTANLTYSYIDNDVFERLSRG